MTRAISTRALRSRTCRCLAPKESQDVIKEFGRPDYDKWLAQFPHSVPLETKAMVDAFRRWDQDIGTRKTK